MQRELQRESCCPSELQCGHPHSSGSGLYQKISSQLKKGRMLQHHEPNEPEKSRSPDGTLFQLKSLNGTSSYMKLLKSWGQTTKRSLRWPLDPWERRSSSTQQIV
ncbi:hypothetical protein XENOCAPTIV_016959 [Xenoophorus captivus]|uniref:Uncharacterized protein n=1 Tax=Xenoophorus captivus TaxID=1517983 RepID=A0ABV0QEH7_9TELE